MFCTHCATSNPPDASLCHGCGARLDTAHIPAPVSRSRSHHRWILLTPVFVALCAVLLLGWRSWSIRHDRSVAYAQAISAREIGDLSGAIEALGRAGDYRDAPERRIELQQQRALWRATLLDAHSALDRGETSQAIMLLRPMVDALPNDQAASDLLTQAEQAFRDELEHHRSLATNGGDWLEVERITLQLAFLDGVPPDAAIFDSLRLRHAPILFVRDDALYRIGPDLTGEQLIFDRIPVTQPLWSPGRSMIAFFSSDSDDSQPNELFVISTDGAQLRQIDDRAVFAPPAWHPNGHELVYLATTESDIQNGVSSLRFIDLNDGSFRTLAPPTGYDRFSSPSWSGDGQRLVVIAENNAGSSDLFIIDESTLELEPASIDLPANLHSVSWSPTLDTFLLWTSPESPGWRADPGIAIYSVSLVEKKLIPITPGTQAPTQPVWAPDGLHFAYLDRGATLHIRKVGALGERSTALPNTGNGDLSWGPGGVGIVVASTTASNPVMLIPIGERIGPVELLTLSPMGNAPAIYPRWGSSTEPLPELYDPLAPTVQFSG